MAWTSMHFATGMIGGAAVAGAVCLATRRGWRWLPAAMTLGGLWAIVPDTPRLFREDFTSLGLRHTLGSHDLERKLHAVGDLFFFHHQLDAQPRELALHGVILMIVLYNAAIALLLVLEWRQRHSPAARAFRAHGERALGTAEPRRRAA